MANILYWPGASPQDNLARLKEAGELEKFIRRRKGQWNHQDWLSFLEKMQEVYGDLDEDSLGRELESLKLTYQEAADRKKRTRNALFHKDFPASPEEENLFAPIKTVLEAGSTYSQEELQGFLFICIIQNYRALICYLLKNTNLDLEREMSFNGFTMTPLQIAVMNKANDPEIIEMLLRAGADPFRRTEKVVDALAGAIGTGCHQALRVILKVMGPGKIRNYREAVSGATVLQLAEKFKNTEALRLLSGGREG